MKKLILFFIVILLASGSFVSAQRELEADYPSIFGTEIVPQTVEGTTLPDYIQYVFTFALSIAALAALIVLVYGGTKYLTSAGSPSQMADAKDQIFSGLLGLVILFSSYLILNTINPQLTVFEIPGLISAPSVPPPPPPTEPTSPDPLIRIKSLSETIKTISLELENVGKKMNAQMSQCSCANTSAECYCNGLSCTPKRCLIDPCNNKTEATVNVILDGSPATFRIAPGQLREEITISQRGIIAKTDEILYYKDRVSSEKEDIGPELEDFISRGRLTEAQGQDLLTSLNGLITSLQDIATAASPVSRLPASCLPDNCTPSCSQNTCDHYCSSCGSCYPDSSCYPTGCSGTPCPSGASQIATLESMRLIINKMAEHIISILE